MSTNKNKQNTCRKNINKTKLDKTDMTPNNIMLTTQNTKVIQKTSTILITLHI